VRQASVTVDGNVTLAYLELGAGPPVVCLPGWSQAAEQFEPVMQRLATDHRVLALDHRGHGRSGQPGRGYRLHRLAADLHEILVALELEQVTLLGHSMGVAVIWAYLDLFGPTRLDRLVLADSRPTLVRDRDWSDAEALVAGRARRRPSSTTCATGCAQWIATSIPGARLATIPAEEGGSHFAFWENPERFATIVAEFLAPDRF
jgi:pimeloyl-ACP methyl ester carboxylesterase